MIYHILKVNPVSRFRKIKIEIKKVVPTRPVPQIKTFSFDIFNLLKMWNFEIRFVRDLGTKQIVARHFLRYIKGTECVVLIRIEEMVTIDEKHLTIEFKDKNLRLEQIDSKINYEINDGIIIFIGEDMKKQIINMQNNPILLEEFPDDSYQFYNGLLSFENEV
jgi:hypothetical protein